MISDAALLARCRSGDAAAWKTLIGRYQGFIFSAALRCGLNQTDAEDVFQNVCLKWCLHVETIRDDERLAGWLGSVTRQECLRLHQRHREALPLSDAFEIPDDARIDEALLHEERLLWLRAAIQTLPEKCRTLLALLFPSADPLSYAEVATRLGVPIGSIGPRRAACLERLRKKIDES